jgi:5-methylcytosine-specific restriction protein A
VPTKPRVHGAQHARQRARQYDRDRQVDHSFYSSAAWKAVRIARLRMEPLCRQCKAEGFIVAAAIADHIKERKDFPELELDLDNTRSLCISHHNRRTRLREQGREL